jgi:DNA-binding protein YbaB
MFDKMKQLHQMKEQMDAAKERMNAISVKGEYQGEEIAELITLATNKALESAEGVFESEMKGMAGGLMGGLGF